MKIRLIGKPSQGFWLKTDQKERVGRRVILFRTGSWLTKLFIFHQKTVSKIAAPCLVIYPGDASTTYNSRAEMSTMDYVVIARKYRPQTFSEVVGQEAIARTLTNAITRSRVAHGFLFTGPSGVGKTTMARILAKALACETGPTATPCGICDHCAGIADSRHPDIYEIDAATHNGVDDIRELSENATFAPSMARYRIYILDEVHMLSAQAWNALLKLLEEPLPTSISSLPPPKSIAFRPR